MAFKGKSEEGEIVKPEDFKEDIDVEVQNHQKEKIDIKTNKKEDE